EGVLGTDLQQHREIVRDAPTRDPEQPQGVPDEVYESAQLEGSWAIVVLDTFPIRNRGDDVPVANRLRDAVRYIEAHAAE
ncbi:hypothetical protein IAE22_35495, partial [Bacillus sp. S34]|nr:hypothetical protein [Bacillus sp. S34]